MTNLELEKTANEVRKGIVTAVHSAKAAAGMVSMPSDRVTEVKAVQ